MRKLFVSLKAIRKYIDKNSYLAFIMLVVIGRVAILGIANGKESFFNGIKKITRKKLAIIVATLLLISLSILIAMPLENYFSSLLRSFYYQAIFIYLLLGIVFIMFRFRMLSVLAIVTAILLILTMNVQPGPSLDNKEATFRAAQFNVLVCNRHYQKTIDRAMDSEADLISFQEVNESWKEALSEALSEAYPWSSFESGKSGIQGLAVFSKYPLSNLKSTTIAGVPSIEGDMLFHNNKIHFISTHTSSPITYSRFRQRNAQIKKLSAYLKKVKGPVIALGDYNAVPWDSCILAFKKNSGLLDSRKEMTPTFPSYFKSFGIPIDYIFHSADMSCLDFRSIDGTSSDHLGVIGYYNFKELSL